MIRDYLRFLGRAYVLSFTGGKLYYGWMTVLTVIAAVGARHVITSYSIHYTKLYDGA